MERHVEHEVAIARRTSRGRAGRDIEIARTLRAEFRDTAVALERGEITLEHAAALVVGTRHVASERGAGGGRGPRPAAGVRRAARRTFRKHVDAAVCAVDAADEARRHARAKGDRQVWVRRIGNGLGELHVIDEWPVVNAMYERITDEATAPAARAPRRSGRPPPRPTPRRIDAEPLDDGWVDRTLDNCRADALSDLVLRDDDDDDDPSERRARTSRRRHRPTTTTRPRIEGRLVIDLATLRGEADNPCLLDGSPIPAPDRTQARPRHQPLAAHGHRPRRRTPPRLRPAHLPARDPADLRRRTRPDLPQPLVRPTRTPLRHGPRRPLPRRTRPAPPTPEPSAPTATPSRPTAARSSTTPPPTAPATWRTAWGQRVRIRPTRYLDDGGTRDTPPTTDQPRVVADPPAASSTASPTRHPHAPSRSPPTPATTRPSDRSREGERREAGLNREGTGSVARVPVERESPNPG